MTQPKPPEAETVELEFRTRLPECEFLILAGRWQRLSEAKCPSLARFEQVRKTRRVKK